MKILIENENGVKTLMDENDVMILMEKENEVKTL